MNKSCNYCGAALEAVLDLGAVALAGDFRRRDEEGTGHRYPLAFAFCPSCLVAQVMDPVAPEAVFRDVRYRAGAVPANRRHFDVLAREIVRRHAPRRVLDIGCNDGTLALALARRGTGVVGVDPSPAATAGISDPAVTVVNGFFGAGMARDLGTFDVVTANNVLAHVADADDFLDGVARCLAPGGAFIIETHHLDALLRHCQYDDIYHEHRAYFSLLALRRLLQRHGFHPVDAEMLLPRGGTLRVTAKKGTAAEADSVGLVMCHEWGAGLDMIEPFHRFAGAARLHRDRMRRLVAGLKDGGAAVPGYGASGRAANLIQVAGLDVDFMVDDTPEKVGRLMPGTAIPILSPDALDPGAHRHVIAFAWSFLADIKARHPGHDWIVPFPAPHIVEGRRAA